MRAEIADGAAIANRTGRPTAKANARSQSTSQGFELATTSASSSIARGNTPNRRVQRSGTSSSACVLTCERSAIGKRKCRAVRVTSSRSLSNPRARMDSQRLPTSGLSREPSVSSSNTEAMTGNSQRSRATTDGEVSRASDMDPECACADEMWYRITATRRRVALEDAPEFRVDVEREEPATLAEPTRDVEPHEIEKGEQAGSDGGIAPRHRGFVRHTAANERGW